ncbi:hypothetical protein [Faunimonas pinastri]|nr:hypothetical protein [Faunimonas pinastri]
MSHATVEGLVGKRVGRTLADDDIAKGEAAEFRALEFSRGSAVEWHSTIDDSHGKVVAGDTSRINDLTCRRYTHTVYILGRPQVGSGTACRQINGSWRLINN